MAQPNCPCPYRLSAHTPPPPPPLVPMMDGSNGGKNAGAKYRTTPDGPLMRLRRHDGDESPYGAIR